jgi:hypothetical protein
VDSGPRRGSRVEHERVRERQEPSDRLRGLAAAQAGCVTREQALGLGLSRHALARLLDQRRWRRLAPGLYLTHDADAAWDALAWGGVLLGGSGARLGGRAAGFAGGLVETAPDPVEVLVPHGSSARSRSHWRFVHERPGVRDPRCTGSPPRLLVPDTVLDLCEAATPRQVEDLVSTAVQRRLTTTRHLERALRRRRRHAHRALLADLLADVGEGAETPLELRYLRDVERRHGLPRGARQRTTRSPGVRDVLYRAHGVLVELDGKLGHEGAGRFRDMRRDNAALMEQLLSLRYGYADVVGEACLVAAQVGQLLQWRGWPGTLRRCPACPRDVAA